jgi:hypothetical protein
MSKVEEFRAWLADKGLEIEAGTSPYMVFRVFNEGTWMGVWFRDRGKEHFTVDKRMDYLVVDYIRERETQVWKASS